MMRRRFIAAISVVLFTVSCGEDSPFTPGEILAPLNIPFSNVDLTVGTGAEACLLYTSDAADE